MATTLLALTDKENPRTKRYAATTYSCSSQKGTLVFGAPHGFRVGDHVAVSGANNDAFNGVFEVISVDSITAVSTLMPGAPDGSPSGTPFVSRIIEAAHTGFPLLIDPKSGRLLVEGAGGGGKGVPDPTRHDIVQLYSYDPNLGGAAWRDDRAMFKVVDDRAALMALKSPSEVVDGSIVLRLDNNLAYRFTPPVPATAPITDKNWHVVMGAIPVPNETTRQGLSHDTLTPGQIAIVANGKKIWMWTGNSSRYNNGWLELTDYPTRTDIRQRYVFDPEVSSGSELSWIDDRGALSVVPGEADLHTIPLSHLMTGKLVYVQGNRTLYEFVSSPTAKTNTMADWDAVELGIPEYNRQADLPQPTPTRAVEEGELAMVRFHADAVTRLNQLFIARFLNPATPNVATWMPVNNEIFEKALRADPDVPDAADGDIQITSEVGHFELKRYDKTAGAWKVLYSEDLVKQWIAAGNLFTGTIQEAGHGVRGAIEVKDMPAQSALGATEKGHYYTWAGSGGYTLPANSIGGSASAVDGALMNPGDWIQVAETSPGIFAYTHIPGDLLAKARGDALYGLSTWRRGAYEKGTLVVFQGKIYKAARPIVSTDGNPITVGSGWNVVALTAGLRTVATDNDRPPTAPRGDVYLVLNSAIAGNKPALYVYDTPSAQWRIIGGGAAGSAMNLSTGKTIVNVGVPVGTIIHWPSATLPDGYMLCDGTGFDNTLFPELFSVLGKATLPDLRGQFLRGANGNFDSLAKHQWTTGMPRNHFATGTQGVHDHHYTSPATGSGGLKSSDHWANETFRYPGGARVSAAGGHDHTINGGDSETAPDHVIVTICIKATPDTMKLRP
jgi:hypothetical protein